MADVHWYSKYATEQELRLSDTDHQNAIEQPLR